MSKIKTLLFPLILFQIYALGQTTAPVPWLDNNINLQNTLSGDIMQKDLFTGTANVNIPFYKANVDGVDLSVGMNYNTQGIQVDQLSSNIGLGWGLYSGGYIERQVIGIPDDINIAGGIEVISVPYGTPGGIIWIPISFTRYPLIGAWVTNSADAPDVFYICLGNRKFKFMISSNGAIATIPDSKIKVTRLINNAPPTGDASYLTGGNLSFVVTDESGNQYYFQQSAYGIGISTLYSDIGTNNSNYNIITKWALQKVVTYEGKEVDYNYEATTVYKLLHVSQVFREQNNNYGEAEQQNTEEYDSLRLKSIVYPNNTIVNFNYDHSKERCDLANDYRLSQIDITENVLISGAIKNKYSYKFNQAYFSRPDRFISYSPSSYITGIVSDEVPLSTPSSTPYDYSLKLKSIDLLGFDGTTKNFYTFDYSPVPLPERIYSGRDIYGFANGSTPIEYKNSNGGDWYLLIPQHSFSGMDYSSGTGTSISTIGINRNVSTDVNYISACVLQKITNSGKGQLSLTYQALSSLGLTAGGVALNSMVTYDGYNHDNDVTTQYQYSNGEVFVPEGDEPYEYKIYDPGSCPSHGSLQRDWTIYSNSAAVINKGLNRSDYGFKDVDEYIKDKTGYQLKHTHNNFTGLHPTTISDNAFSSGTSLLTPPFSNKQYVREWGLGLCNYQITYDYLDNPIKKDIYNYSVSTSTLNSAYWTGTVGFPKAQGCRSLVDDFYYDTHGLYTGNSLLQSVETQTYYDNTHYIDQVENYTYDNNYNAISKSYTNSLGETILQKNYYTYNWLGTSYAPGPGITSLNNDGVQRLVYTEKWKNNIGGTSNTNLTGLRISGYNTISSGSKIVRPTYSYDLLKGTPLPATSFSGIASLDINDMTVGSPVSNFFITGANTLYDDKGNSVESMEPGGHKKALVFDNEQSNTLAQVSNASYPEIAYCGFESDYAASGTDYKKGNWGFANSSVSTDHIFLGRFSFHCSSVANSTLYTTGNLTVGKQYTVSFWVYGTGTISVNDGVNAIPNSSNPNALTVVKSYNSWKLYKTTFTAKAAVIGIWGEGYIDEMKLYPANTMMKTSNYLPLIGKTADVDANDNITFYQYDNFGNLSVTKDQYGNVISKSITVTQGAE